MRFGEKINSFDKDMRGAQTSKLLFMFFASVQEYFANILYVGLC